MPPAKIFSGAGKDGRLGAVLAGLSAAAFAAAVLTWIYLAEWPLSIVFLLLGALLAGAAAALLWSRAMVETSTGIATLGGESKRASALPWAEIVAAMPDPVIVLDRSFIILRYNAAARALFDSLQAGLSLEQVNRDPELIAAVTRAFESGEKCVAHLAPRGRAEQRLIATATSFGGTEHLPPAAVLITFRDESEQHRILEMRSDFIANASHELRTPLASVSGFIETLQGPARYDEAAREQFLIVMAEQAARMKRLIDDLLLLSRVEEKVNLKPTGRVDLKEVLDDVVRTMKPAANERRIKIDVEVMTAPLIASGDRDELFQVFRNIVENAVKYGREGGAVRISATAKRVSEDGKFLDWAVVTISDNGPGIAPDHLPRLTERFYRVSTEHSRRIGGTGLGLAIVKHVLNRHEGELSIDSVVGEGTTVRISVPAAS